VLRGIPKCAAEQLRPDFATWRNLIHDDIFANFRSHEDWIRYGGISERLVFFCKWESGIGILANHFCHILVYVSSTRRHRDCGLETSKKRMITSESFDASERSYLYRLRLGILGRNSRRIAASHGLEGM
jgi:hypothetical protein